MFSGITSICIVFLHSKYKGEETTWECGVVGINEMTVCPTHQCIY